MSHIYDNVKSNESQVKSMSSAIAKHNVTENVPSILDLQEKMGNQWVLNRLAAGLTPGSAFGSIQSPIQPKLKIGQPNDKYEQEADRVADSILQMRYIPERKEEREEEKLIQVKPIAEQITPLVQRQVEKEEEVEEEKEFIQPKHYSNHINSDTPEFEFLTQSLKGSGRPLSRFEREFFEPRFGYDFSNVRIHTDTVAVENAYNLNAMAYTLGHDIFFGAGWYNPETPTGRWILAHELTHIVQQGAKPISPNTAIEFELSDVYEMQANDVARVVSNDFHCAPVGINISNTDPSIMLLTPDEFRKQLGSTPKQKAAIDTLFVNANFKNLWEYLENCKATPKQDLGPLALKVTPGLTMGGAERFGGYFGLTRTLEINPTKPEHVSNPIELVDTVAHELIHAVDDLQTECKKAGSGNAPLKGAKTVWGIPSLKDVKGTPKEDELLKKYGPGASNPCEEFLDINDVAQQMIVQIIVENIKISGVGHPTITFVNEILRRDPAALSEYKSCRDTACKKPTKETRRKAVGQCSAKIIGKYIPKDLRPALFPTRVHFNYNSTKLLKDSLEIIDLVALYLKAHPKETVELIGHADPRGTEEYNEKLGLNRANAVKKRLLKKGVPSMQIRSVTSEGEKKTISTGPETYWKDRRVEIKL